MTEDEARELAHEILNIFAKAHLEDRLAKPFIIDMSAERILHAFKQEKNITEEEEVIEAIKSTAYLKDINDELYSIRKVLLEIADTLALGLLKEDRKK